MQMLQFYRECIARAFSGKFLRVEGWTAILGLVVFLLGKLDFVPERFRGMLNDDLVMYFFLLAFCVTVFFGLIAAPYTIYKEEREKAFQLEKARLPKLKVFLRDEDGTREYVGGTSQTKGGKRYTHLRQSTSNALSLVVQNTGETRIEKCTANLVWIECVEGEDIGERTLYEPIRLAWNHVDVENHLEASLDPNASLRVWIADVNYKGWTWLMRDASKLPVDYQQIFGATGRYRAIIQVTDGHALSIETRVEIAGLESEATEVYPSGTGKATISILEQDSPSLPRSSTVNAPRRVGRWQ